MTGNIKDQQNLAENNHKLRELVIPQYNLTSFKNESDKTIQTTTINSKKRKKGSSFYIIGC